MKFIVEKSFFDKIDNACFGVLIVKGIDNTKDYQFIDELLINSCQKVASDFEEVNVKQDSHIENYREAFRKVGINPNKFMCSIEALVTRVKKNKNVPNINPIVDLTNALSLKYLIPLGVHNIDSFDGDIEFRLGKESDIFIPMGKDFEDREMINSDEYVYVSGSDVKTRRWAWRQGERGKITNKSSNIFIPIDGFVDINKNEIIELRDELAKIFKDKLNTEVKVGYVDKDNREFIIEEDSMI